MSAEAEASESQLFESFNSVLPVESLNEVTTVIAVSGGPDSVALAHLVARRSPGSARIILAHFNHRLRGLDSDKDEEFVRELARQLDLEYRGGCAEESPIPDSEKNQSESNDLKNGHSNAGQSLEALARHDRYQFMENTVAETGARFLLTAHTLNDQVETVVYRFFRGSGIRGLTGIRPVREWLPGVSLVRPFLNATKELILDYLSENQISFRVDCTNQTQQFARNRIRNELLPLAQQIFSNSLNSSILSLVDNCTEYQQLVDPQTEKLMEEFVSIQQTQVRVQLDRRLLTLPAILLNELWSKIWTRMNWPQQQMNRGKWNSITHLASGKATASKINLPGDLLAERESDCLIIEAASAIQHRPNRS